MTGNKENFVELENHFSAQVKLGDGKTKQIEGKGVVVVQTMGGQKKYIHDVYYVPGLAQNLLSVGQLVKKGYSLHFDNGECKIVDKNANLTVARVNMTLNNVFYLIMPLCEKFAFKTEKDESYL